jgi:hypothetical protein
MISIVGGKPNTVRKVFLRAKLRKGWEEGVKG